MLSTRKTETAAPVLQSGKRAMRSSWSVSDRHTYANFNAQSLAAKESNIEALVVPITPLCSPCMMRQYTSHRASHWTHVNIHTSINLTFSVRLV